MRLLQSFAILLTILFLSPDIYSVIESKNSLITEVTVFQNQAKIVRAFPVSDDFGTHDVTFSHLPLKLIPSTLRAYTKNKADVSILGLTHQIITKEIKSDDDYISIARKLDTLINIKEAQLAGYLESFKQQKVFLSQFTETSKKAVETNMTEGSIDMKTWDNAFRFIGTNLKDLNDSINYYNRQIKFCRQHIADYKHQLKNAQKIEYQKSISVDISVSFKKHVTDTIFLEYLIPDASWKPVYNARLQPDESNIAFTLMADITQNTGEDWTDVAVSISSTNPTESIGAGQLIPWYIGRYIDFSLYKGMYGSINGSLYDKETKKPIYGASILIQNKSFGSTTNHNGSFSINKLEPGVYNLRISHLEYNTVDVQDVIVLPEQGEPFNFFLSKKVTDFGEEISVVASHDILDKFKTQNQVVIERKPVTTVDELLHGNTDREYFIRGGRAFEVGYIVDGLGGMNSQPTINIKNKLLTPVSSQNFLLKDGVKLDRNDFKTTFHLTQTETIPSNDKAIRVLISENILPCNLQSISRPKRKEHVFRLARITNLDNLPLYSGLVHLFVESDFIGKAVIADFIAPNQEFELPFGIDKAIKIRRSLSDYNKDFGKSDIKLKQKINISMTNNSTREINLIIEEPLPVTVDDDVEIKFGDISPKEFTLYENGVAQWIRSIHPNQSDTISVPIEIKYPKNMAVKGIQ